MEVEARIVRLELAETFVIARDATDFADVVQVAVTHESAIGYGEAAPVDRYDESPKSAKRFVEEHGSLLGDDPFALEDVGERLADDPGRAGGEGSARRCPARSSGEAPRAAGGTPARPPAVRPADLLDDLAR